MAAQERSHRVAWVIMLVLPVLLLVWTVPLLLLSGGSAILEQGLDLAGSPLSLGDLDDAALGYINMAMLKPLWEEIWIGILGLYCAFGLRQKKKHAWTLGIFWGVMLITNAAIQGAYEVVILRWRSACLQTYLFLLLGTIAVASLSITRRGFLPYQPRRLG